LIVSWCQPEPANCDAASRRRWLAACCPQHESAVLDDAALAEACIARGLAPRTLPPDASDDATQQHFLAWLLAEVLQRSPDAMFASEPYVQPCAAVLSRRLGHAVTPVLVDPTRQTVPVSATRIRQAPDSLRHFLPAAVWADWVPHVCFLGGESSGKSTLAAALAARHGMVQVAEYGRELWVQQGGELKEPDLLHIAQMQQAREAEMAATAPRIVFCDTSVLTTLFYALDGFGRADPELVERARRPYRLNVLCEPDFPFVQDGTRRGEAFRQHQHAWYLREIGERQLPWLRVHGSLTQRVRQVETTLGIQLPEPPAPC
jgi:NadR type nicotinamide-nucleotide adenylyltransferase